MKNIFNINKEPPKENDIFLIKNSITDKKVMDEIIYQKSVFYSKSTFCLSCTTVLFFLNSFYFTTFLLLIATAISVIHMSVYNKTTRKDDCLNIESYEFVKKDEYTEILNMKDKGNKKVNDYINRVQDQNRKFVIAELKLLRSALL